MVDKKTSKYLSFLLRHNPEKEGLVLDKGGWCQVDQVLSALSLSFDQLKQMVEQNDKKRFTLSEDGKRIRAAQGHSISVDLGLKPTCPPPILYHGTKKDRWDSIRKIGLVRGNRTHVHLSADTGTATKVADRRDGASIILEVKALEMYQVHYLFYLSDNGVWLTEEVPARFIKIKQ